MKKVKGRYLTEAELAALASVLKGCLVYFREFDKDRADGRTSPIITEIEAALAALDTEGEKE